MIVCMYQHGILNGSSYKAVATRCCGFWHSIFLMHCIMYHLISSNPGVLGGKPVIKGTRISVEMITEWIATGASVGAICKSYPHLPAGSVQQALQYAAQFAKNEILIEEEI